MYCDVNVMGPILPILKGLPLVELNLDGELNSEADVESLIQVVPSLEEVYLRYASRRADKTMLGQANSKYMGGDGTRF